MTSDTANELQLPLKNELLGLIETHRLARGRTENDFAATRFDLCELFECRIEPDRISPVKKLLMTIYPPAVDAMRIVDDCQDTGSMNVISGIDWSISILFLASPPDALGDQPSKERKLKTATGM